MKTPLRPLIGCLSLLLTAQVALADQPVQLALALPLDGVTFHADSIAFSESGDRLCIAGTDSDEMGTSTARLMLVDRKRNSVEWQKTIPVPDGLANVLPVQCLVGTEHVFLLANADTSLSPPQAQTETHVIAFDFHGNQSASRRLDIPGANRRGRISTYGYAVVEASAGLTIAGYTKDQDADTERYATYTVTLDPRLRQQNAALVRKNGAYTYPPAARIVGDNIYLAGRFFRAVVSDHDIGEFAASRLRTGGGYLWSTRTGVDDLSNIQIVIADDGTTYSLGYTKRTTMLSAVTPAGKALVPLTFPSTYCRTYAVAPYGNGIVAVRAPCSGQGNALVAIDTTTGKEQTVKSIAGEPFYVATKGPLWAVMARDKLGKSYLYSARGGL